MSSFEFNITANRVPGGNPNIKSMACPDGTTRWGTTLELCEMMVKQLQFPEYGTVVTRNVAGEILDESPRPPPNHRLIGDVKATIDGREYGSLAIFAPDPDDTPIYGPRLPTGAFYHLPPTALVSPSVVPSPKKAGSLYTAERPPTPAAVEPTFFEPVPIYLGTCQVCPATAEARIVKRKKLSARKSGEGRPPVFADVFPYQEPADAKDGDDIPVQPNKTVRTMKTTKKK